MIDKKRILSKNRITNSKPARSAHYFALKLKNNVET